MRIPAPLLAQTLHRIFVLEDNKFCEPEEYKLPSHVHTSFRTRMRQYREALLLLSLVVKSKDDTKFESVLHECERIIFPKEPTDAGKLKLEVMKDSMRDLSIITRPSEDPNLQWSMTWFAAIGHSEGNPITCFAFAIFWMDQYIAIHKSLGDFKPI